MRKMYLAILLFFICAGVNAQSYSYSYIEPCSGKSKTLTIPYGQNNITVDYYGNVNSFNQNDFNNGVFASWMSSIAQLNSSQPCGEITTVLTNNINMTVTQNVLSTVMNVTSIAAMAQSMSSLSSNLGGSMSSSLGNTVSNGEGGNGESGGSKKDKNKNGGNSSGSNSTNVNGSDASSSNGNNTSSNGQVQGSQGSQVSGSSGSSNSGGSGSNSGNPGSTTGSSSTSGSGTSTAGSTTTTGGTTTGSNTTSGASSTTGNPSTTGGATGSTTTTGGTTTGSNTTGEASSTPGSTATTGGTTSGSSTTGSTTTVGGTSSTAGSTTTTTGSNTTGTSTTTGGTTAGSSTAVTPSAGNTTSAPGTNQENSSTARSGGSGGTANSISNAEDNSSGGGGGKNGGSKAKTGSMIGSGDIVALKSAEDPTAKNQFKFTGSLTHANTNNTRITGVLGNFTTEINNINLTVYKAWVIPKSQWTIIGANSTMIDFERDAFNTTTALGSKRFKGNWKKLTAMGGLNFTAGKFGERKFYNLSAVGGGFYSFNMSKKLSGSILCLAVYSPFTQFYDGQWWSSSILMVPFSSWDYSITKTFKFNISFSGVYEINKNFMNYQILTGGKILL